MERRRIEDANQLMCFETQDRFAQEMPVWVVELLERVVPFSSRAALQPVPSHAVELSLLNWP